MDRSQSHYKGGTQETDVFNCSRHAFAIVVFSSIRSKYFYIASNRLDLTDAIRRLLPLTLVASKLRRSVLLSVLSVCVCVFATDGREGGRAVSAPYCSQRARSVCVTLSVFFIFYLDLTSIRLQFDCTIRPFDDRRYDVLLVLHCDLNNIIHKRD